MPGRLNLKPTLMRIWHAPDNLRLMDPLPSFHRKGIIIAALVLIIGFLLPNTPPSPPAESPRDDTAVGQNQQAAPTPSVSPPPTESASSASEPPQQTHAPFDGNDIEQNWRTYRLESGKTLAQLFRDNGLPVEDVYAIAEVEGDEKPLSALQSGQTVKIRQNVNGVVTGLSLPTDNTEVLFTRQPDGSFLRVQ